MLYPLRTRRLSISPLTERDTDAFVAYRQDPDVARWQGWDVSYSAADASLLIGSQPTTEIPEPGGWLQLALHDSETGVLHGDVAIHTLVDFENTFELGVTLRSESQRQGLAREALQAMLDYLFARAKAHRVVAVCDARNGAVAALLQRVGMRRESRQVDVEFFRGEWVTLDGWALLKREHSPAP